MSDKDGKDAICVNDPNYAIICKFLQKFAVLCNITTIDTIILQKQIENTDEVPTELFDLLVKLLRKNKYTVHLERWERAVIKFCYTYSNQDAWEIERFGYKKSKCAVKLRVLKSLLEAQFDINNKFKAAINAIPANELRSSPLGRDKYGNSYWSTLDEGCNLKIYQEHLDEETWHMVASTRDELCNLIERLKGNEKIGPSLVGIVDEDSSSINSVNSKNDGEEIVMLDSENHIKDGKKNHIECDESNKNENDNASDITCAENDVKKDDNKSKEDNSIQTTRLLLLASKPPSKKKSETQVKSNVTESQTNESKNFKPNNSSEEDESDEETEKVEDKNVSSSGEEGDDDEEGDEEEQEEEEEEDDDDVEGADSDDDEIEEPIQHVIGEGSGKDNNAFNPGYFEDNLPEFSEIVEEETFYTFGEGNGSECLVGNSDSNESSSNSSSKKPMFFFGQPGCLKLSPTKSSSSTTDSNREKDQTSRNKKDDDIFNLLNFGSTSKSKSDLVPSSVDKDKVKIDKEDPDETILISTEDNKVQISLIEAVENIQDKSIIGKQSKPKCITIIESKDDKVEKLETAVNRQEKVEEKCLLNESVIDKVEKISPPTESEIPTTTNIPQIATASNIDQSKILPSNVVNELLLNELPTKTSEIFQGKKLTPILDTNLTKSKLKDCLNVETELLPSDNSRKDTPLNKTPVVDEIPFKKFEKIQEKDLTIESKTDISQPLIASKATEKVEEKNLESKTDISKPLIANKATEKVEEKKLESKTDISKPLIANKATAKVEEKNLESKTDVSKPLIANKATEKVKERKLESKTETAKPLIVNKATEKVEEKNLTATSSEIKNLTPTDFFTKTVSENQLVTKESKSKESLAKPSNAPATKITAKPSLEASTTKLEAEPLEKPSCKKAIVKAVTKDEEPLLKSQIEDRSTKSLENAESKSSTLVEEPKPSTLKVKIKDDKKIVSIQPAKTKVNTEEIPVTHTEEPKSSISNKPTKEEQITKTVLVTAPSIIKSTVVNSPTKIAGKVQEKLLDHEEPSKKNETKQGKNPSSSATNVDSSTKINKEALNKPLALLEESKSSIAKNYSKEEKVVPLKKPPILEPSSKIKETVLGKPEEHTTLIVKTLTPEDKKLTEISLIKPSIGEEVSPKATKKPQEKPLALVKESKSSIAKTPTEVQKPNSSNKLVEDHKSSIKIDKIISKQNLPSVSKVIKPSKIVETPLEPKLSVPPAVLKVPLIEPVIKDSTKTIEKVQEKLTEKPKTLIPTAAKEEKVAKQQLSPITKVPLVKSASAKTMDKPDKIVEASAKNDKQSLLSVKKVPLIGIPIEEPSKKITDEPKASVKEANVPTKNPLPVVLKRPDKISKKEEIPQIKSVHVDTIQNKDLIKPVMGETSSSKIETNTSNVKSKPVTSKQIDDLKEDKLESVLKVPVIEPLIKDTSKRSIEKVQENVIEKPKTSIPTATKEEKVAKQQLSPEEKLKPKKSDVPVKLAKDIAPNFLPTKMPESLKDSNVKSKTVTSKQIEGLKKDKLEVNEEKIKPKKSELPDTKIIKSAKDIAPSCLGVTMPEPSKESTLKINSKKIENIKDSKTSPSAQKIQSEANLKQSTVKPPGTDKQNQSVVPTQEVASVINLEKEPVKKVPVEIQPIKTDEIKRSPVKIVEMPTPDKSVKTHKVVEKIQPDRSVKQKPDEIENSQIVPKLQSNKSAKPSSVKISSSESESKKIETKPKNSLSEPKVKELSTDKQKEQETLEANESKSQPETIKEITKVIENPLKMSEEKIVENVTTPQIINNVEATIKKPDQDEPLSSKVEKSELESTSRKRKNDEEEPTTKTSTESVDKSSKKQKIEKPEPETIKTTLRNRKSNVNEIGKKQDDPIDDVEMKIVSSIVSKTKPQKSDEKKPSPVKSKTTDTKKRRTDVDSSLILENTGENEPPVRQSRRIAQLKIKEEAERRHLEEMVLKKMKEESNKKKKEEGIDVKPGEVTHSESDSGSDSKKSIKKKTPKKKKDGTHPWNNSDTSDTEHEEEEEEDGLEYRDEELPPLKSDHEFSPESDLEDETQVIPTKRARTVKKEESEEESDDSPIHACQKCNKHDHPEWILLCDTCDKGYHCSCLTPVLFIIPEGDWFCPLCQHEKLIENLNIQLEELDKILHQRELEKQRRERLAYTSISLENMLTEKKKNRSKTIKEESSSDESSDDNSSDSDEPIYKLRKRKQTVLSYNFNEYDDLINSAIKQDVKEDVVENTGAGNLGRGKDISTIMEADKEEQLRNMEMDEKPSETEAVEQKSEIKEDVENKSESESDDSEPIKRPIKKLKMKKKHRKLNSLDIESDDDSDDDFKAKISSNDSEEDENYSGSESESSLENRWSRKKKKNARPVRERRKRFEKKFINDGESDESFEAPKKKKKKREDSDFSDFNEDDDDDEEEELDVDSDELCDDTDSSNSNTAWKPSKKSKDVAKVSKPKPEIKPTTFPKKKTPKLDEDTPFKSAVSKTDPTNEEDGDIRRTRGKKRTYLEDYDDESSDDGIKPGVKRPDTPPEERELFIKKQEEIKRMLAAKNTNAALMIAAPTQIQNTSKMTETNLDSISAVPLHVIQNAKALDADYHQRTKPTDDDEFDDLPEDFNPEDMDEEQIAKMMEEEDFAQKQLKLAGEAIRNKKLKDAEILKRQAAERLNNSVELDPTGLKLTKAGLEPKKRGRKSKSELQAIADARSKLEGQFSPLVLASQIPQDGNMPFSPNLLQGPSASIVEPPSHIDHHNIPTTVFAVQGNLGQMEQTLTSSNDESPLKKRGRRKKITPLRESLRPINFTELNTPISQMKPELMVDNKTTTVLSDRLSVSPDTNKLAVAAPPQLYTPGAGISPSVITRLQRPSIPPSFNSQGPPRFFAPMSGSPHMLRSPYPATSGRPMQSSSPNVLSANGSPDIVMQPGVNFDQRIRHSHGPHAIFRPSTTMYVGHGFPNPSNLHHGLQPVNTPTTTEIGIRGPAPPRDYHGPYLGAPYGGFYPAPQLAIPANTTGVTPPPSSSSNSSYEQFETLKTTTAEPEVSTPVFAARSEEEAGSTTGTSEFSGLVSYFSSQHDDLET